MTASTQKPATTPASAPEATAEPTPEQLDQLQAVIDEAVAAAVAKALEEQKASAGSASSVPSQIVSVVEEPIGRQFLGKSDFVPLWDKDGKELPAVPKHWAADQLPLGSTKKKPAEDSKS